MLARETDQYVMAAAISSLRGNFEEVLKAALEFGASLKILEAILITQIGFGQHADLDRLWDHVSRLEPTELAPFLVALLDATERRKEPPAHFLGDRFITRWQSAAANARSLVANDKTPAQVRNSLVILLGRLPEHRDSDLQLLGQLIAVRQAVDLQLAALAQLARLKHDQVPHLLLERFAEAGPQLHEKILDALIARPNWT